MEGIPDCTTNPDNIGETRLRPLQDNSQDKNATDVDTDFSFLPETVWVKVLDYLPLVDKYHVSVTCTTLYALFSHPSLWKSARLFLYGGQHNYRASQTFMPVQFKKIVEKFGDLFQRLTICLTGHLVKIEPDTREILSDLAKVCRLEHLVLEVGIMTSDFHRQGIKPFREDLIEIVQLVQSAFRLKRLEIVSWPMYPDLLEDEEVNVFEVMRKNTKLEMMESLSLFWMRDKQWSELAPILPSPNYTASLVLHYKHLQHLALRSPMLSEKLLTGLASESRTKLQFLQILIMYSAHNSDYAIPELSSSLWVALKTTSPQLKVECTIMSRVPDIELASILKPEIPLVAVNILKFSKCSPQLLRSLKDKFHSSLHSFICYHDPTDCESSLLQMVIECSNLDTLIFHGQIHSPTVIKLANTRKNWQQFEFVKKCIITEAMADDYFDDDIVIGHSATGGLVQVEMIRFHGMESEGEREQALHEMCTQVSKKLNYNWQPV